MSLCGFRDVILWVQRCHGSFKSFGSLGSFKSFKSFRYFKSFKSFESFMCFRCIFQQKCDFTGRKEIFRFQCLIDQ